VDTEELF